MRHDERLLSGRRRPASANARLLDAVTGEQVAAAPVGSGETTVDLAGVSAAAHQSLQVSLGLQSADGQATPRISSFKVSYDSASEAPPPPPPPVPPTLTLVAAPKTIVFGRTSTLSGTLTRSGAPLAGQVVTLAAQPIEAAACAALPTATTDAAGNPPRRQADEADELQGQPRGAASEPTVVVAVKHLITLKALRRSGKLYLRGTVGPRHARRAVVIQKRRGTRWVTIAQVRTSRPRASSWSERRPARLPYRARIAADREHLANLSRVARDRRHSDENLKGVLPPDGNRPGSCHPTAALMKMM